MTVTKWSRLAIPTHSMGKMNQVDASSLSRFDLLPDGAHVRLPVVAALFGVSPATIWRWSRAGTLPAPVHIGGVTMWNVGMLRARLREAGVAPSGEIPPESK